MHVLAFLVCPGALGSPQLRKLAVMKRSGIGIVNQQKQETTYIAVVVNDHTLPISFIHVSMTPFGSNDIGTGIHMIIHYNCTVSSFLFHLFLLIYHPYPT